MSEKIKRFTIDEFRSAYPNDDACLDKLFQLRFGDLSICPKCQKDFQFARVKNRRAYQCVKCGFQLYPTANTVFDKTTTPLNYWFYAIYLQTTTRNGVAAKELERQLNVCYKTALRMAHQIKILMGNRPQSQMEGVAEADETYIGGARKFMHKWKRDKLNEKYGSAGLGEKTPVVAIVTRSGDVRALNSGDLKRKNILPFIKENLKEGSVLNTDKSHLYDHMGEVYKHQIINHELGEYVKGETHTNTVEGFFHLLKRTITGTHLHVSTKHLQKYVDEVCFRYVHRNEQDVMFDKVLKNVCLFLHRLF
jgi:Zn ribbon nucleic-acid-binding protein/transposase-like protein